MRKKRVLLELGIVSFVLMLLLWIFVPKFLGSQRIDLMREFPDPTVRSIVAHKFGVDENSSISIRQAQEFTGTLDIVNHPNDLTGLHHFPNLEWINISSDNLMEINLSKLPNLEHLRFSGANLVRLVTKHNSKLKEVSINSSHFEIPAQIPEFDFSQNPNLVKLTIINFYLEEIDLSTLSNLYHLDLSNSYHYYGKTGKSIKRGLTKLDLSKNPKLKHLRINSNKLKHLDLSHTPLLREVNCGMNELESIKLSNSKKLRSLYCFFNHLTTLNFSACKEINKILCNDNQLETIVFGNNKYLSELVCTNNQIKELDQNILKGLTLFKR